MYHVLTIIVVLLYNSVRLFNNCAISDTMITFNILNNTDLNKSLGETYRSKHKKGWLGFVIEKGKHTGAELCQAQLTLSFSLFCFQLTQNFSS